MNICVFDTETTSLDKPFCYNIGYVIASQDGEILCKRSFVVEQIWHNLPLFQSAYYAEKRPLYVASMKSRKTIMDKFGYICRQMARDFRDFEVSCAYAFNSPFDVRVFDFNSDWYKCGNPFDTIPVYDIRAVCFEYLFNNEYKNFCEDNRLLTDGGNYQTTAESAFRFVFHDMEFEEEHTALADSEIECAVLFKCVENGYQLGIMPNEVPKVLARTTRKPFHIVVNGEEVFSGVFTEKREYKKNGLTIRFKK